MPKSWDAGRRILAAVVGIALCLTGTACVSHLERAKLDYAQAQGLARAYRAADALALYKRALIEASAEARTRPSAQAFMVKGLVEVNLSLWKEAEASFLEAFSYGFADGEEWASQVSLLGLAETFEEMGLRDQAVRSYEPVLGKSKFRPVVLVAAQRYSNLKLAQAQGADEKVKERLLNESLKIIEKLTAADWSCGYYHYLQSQFRSHLGDCAGSFEEAVVARELGLPSEEILRDNDLQIVFCHRELRKVMAQDAWKEFEGRYQRWVRRWGWKDAETPAWKKGEKDAADD
jgi:tetratricopeptide (TPR) repeat protein